MSTLYNLTLDYADKQLAKRSDLVRKHIPDASLFNTISPEFKAFLTLNRPFETYSTGEQILIKFVQSPQTPIDLASLDEETARAALALYTAFWTELLWSPKCTDRCVYSKSMEQEYPRRCVKCGTPEA